MRGKGKSLNGAGGKLHFPPKEENLLGSFLSVVVSIFEFISIRKRQPM